MKGHKESETSIWPIILENADVDIPEERCSNAMRRTMWTTFRIDPNSKQFERMMMIMRECIHSQVSDNKFDNDGLRDRCLEPNRPCQQQLFWLTYNSKEGRHRAF